MTSRKQRQRTPDPVERETIGFRRRREKRERATAFLAGDPLLVGLDLAKRRHAVWLARRDLSPIRRFMVPHSPEGMAQLLERVEAQRAAGGHDRAIFFMEPTSYFWELVANALEAKGHAYRLVAALAVHRSRQIEHLTYAKGDFRDAELIAKLGQNGQWLDRQLERDRLWLDLSALTREHEALLVLEVAERLRLRSILGVAIPEFLDCFASPTGKTARAILRQLTNPPTDLPATYPAVLERAKTTTGHRILRGKIRSFLSRLETGPRFGVETALAPALSRLGLVVDRYDFVAHQRAEVRRRLVALYEKTPYRRVLDTIPSVSPESHALLLGLIGDPKRFDRGTCLAKLAGTEPRENHSGDAEGPRSISRWGQAPLRHLLYRIVTGLAQGNEEFAAYLTRLQKREKNPLVWFQAAVAAGNKYLRLVHHMCVHKEVYDPAKLRAES